MSDPAQFDVAVIGAGPAGLMAAVSAARQGASVCVFERNSSAGRKLLLTGGGRCNLTHAGSIDDFVRACQPWGHLLKPAFYSLSPQALLEFFHHRGLKTMVEPDGCVFPLQATAARVRDILLQAVSEAGAAIRYGCPVLTMTQTADGFDLLAPAKTATASAVIIAAGGASWPGTGSDGLGYDLARQLGHTVESPVGILCPVVCQEAWPASLQGTSLARVTIRARAGKHRNQFSGAMVFTESGLGGPAAFDVSRFSADLLRCGQTVSITLDLCPEFSAEALEATLIQRCAENPKRDIAGILSSLPLPRRLAELLTGMACGSQPAAAGQLPKQQRRHLQQLIKQMPLTVTGCGRLEKATVTRGGVSTGEVDFKTMRSRLCPGLFFAGEVLNVDGPCGGYNLQIAFSTGALAGTHAARWGR